MGRIRIEEAGGGHRRHTTEASMNAVLSSHGLGEDCFAKVEEKENIAKGSEPQLLETTLCGQGSKMQIYWKRPRSPVDMATVMPVLRRLKKLIHKTGLEALHNVPVIHCPRAFAVVLKATERKNSVGKVIPVWKLVYSGDTRPCQSLIYASHNATVHVAFIHEATFEDGLGEEAVARNHNTTMEAIQVGSKAGAYRIILTLFSKIYPKIPVFDEGHMHNICIAFDLMSVNITDLHLLPNVLPYLKSYLHK